MGVGYCAVKNIVLRGLGWFTVAEKSTRSLSNVIAASHFRLPKKVRLFNNQELNRMFLVCDWSTPQVRENRGVWAKLVTDRLSKILL